MFFIRKRIPLVVISTNFKWEILGVLKSGEGLSLVGRWRVSILELTMNCRVLQKYIITLSQLYHNPQNSQHKFEKIFHRLKNAS